MCTYERPEEKWPWFFDGGPPYHEVLRSPKPVVIPPMDPGDVVEVEDEPRWRGYVMRRLCELEAAEGDFTGLQVPTASVVQRARDTAETVFSTLSPTPSVLPDENGNILFVWHKHGWDLEIAVGPGSVDVLADDRGSGRSWSGELDAVRSRLRALLAELARPPRLITGHGPPREPSKSTSPLFEDED